MGTVIFDLDGTLADTASDLIAAANACFEARGLGSLLDPIGDAPTAFRGGRAMLRKGFSRVGLEALDQTIEQDFPKFIAYYTENLVRETVLYPGVKMALKRLREAGFGTGICTNKPEKQAIEVIRLLGVSDLFDSLVAADTLTVRKPDPAPYFAALDRAGGTGRPSLLVGDTETDRETATAAGVPCVLVNFGPEGRGISRLKGDAYLDHFDDMPRLAVELLGKPGNSVP